MNVAKISYHYNEITLVELNGRKFPKRGKELVSPGLQKVKGYLDWKQYNYGLGGGMGHYTYNKKPQLMQACFIAKAGDNFEVGATLYKNKWVLKVMNFNNKKFAGSVKTPLVECS